MSTLSVNRKYRWWKDKKMVGSIVLIIVVSMQIFAFIDVPGITTINKYTIEMAIGFYHPFVYFYIIYIALTAMFNNRINLPTWVKVTRVSYWLLMFSVIFIGTSSGFYQDRRATWTEIGSTSWGSLETWWNQFTSSGNAWIPTATNGGFVGAFLYAVFSSMLSGIGAFAISIILIVISASILITGSVTGIYKDIIKKRKRKLEKIEIKNEQKVDITHLEVKPSVKLESKKNDETTNARTGEMPFDDPFEE